MDLLTSFSGELGSAELRVGLGDFRALFQPQVFYDSVTVSPFVPGPP